MIRILCYVLFAILVSCQQQNVESEALAKKKRQLHVKIDSYFKITDHKDSDELARATQKCRLKKGEILTLMEGTAPKKADDRHYFIELARSNPIPGCEFDKGYIWGPHFNLFENTASASASASTASKKYISPLPNIVYGSSWCECRNIGTSPHIGQDMYNWDASMISRAPRAGTVKSVYLLSSACGNTVEFVDDGGSKWYFLHILNSYVYAGQRIEQGAKIGRHEYYPLPGCGSGPHLHLERVTGGDINDGRCRMNICQYGWSRCNYDPVSVFDGGSRSNRFYACQ